MKIVFFATKPYDSQSFSQIAAQYPQLELEYWEAELSVKTASYLSDTEAVCAFVSSDVSAPVLEELHKRGVKLVLMRDRKSVV